MAQVKVYGRRSVWGPRRTEVSDLLHAALVSTWQLPQDKRFHRFILLADDELIAPRSEAYLIIEIICFEGRSRDAKRALIAAVYEQVARSLGLSADDLELTIVETPKQNWGIRGRSGDELQLSYRVDV